MAADLLLEVIPLRYRNADQMLPVLQPLVPPPGTISGMQNQLVVRTTAANLAEIRRVLDAIDRQPRKLLITVRQDADVGRSGEGAAVSGTIKRGATGSGERLDARVYGTQSLQNDRHTQQLQVLEGNDGYIRVGQSVPVYDGRVVRDVVGGRVVERNVETIDYRDILTGFHVRPRISGDVVTVEISPQRDTPGRYGPGSANVQQVGTTVSGRLGEWMEIGGIVSGRASQTSGATYRTDRAQSEERRILLKVDELR